VAKACRYVGLVLLLFYLSLAKGRQNVRRSGYRPMEPSVSSAELQVSSAGRPTRRRASAPVETPSQISLD